MRRRSVLSETAELLADLVVDGSRTICFLRSRRGIELIQRFTRMRLEELGERGLAARIAPYRGRLHAPAAARDRGAARRRRAARGRRHRRARARDRHRRARRRDLRRRSPGTVASLRQMWGRAGRRTRGDRRLRRRRGRARPVLLPPPGRVPRPARSRRRSSTTRTSGSRPRTCSPPRYEAPLGGTGASPGARRRDPRRRAGASAPTRWSAPGGCGCGRDGRYLPRGARLPGRRDLAALGLAGLGRGGRPRLRASCSARSRPSGPSRPSTRARSTCTSGAPTRSRELDIDGRRAIVDAVRRRLVHAAEEGDGGLHRGGRRAAPDRAAVGRRSSSPSARSRSPSR